MSEEDKERDLLAQLKEHEVLRIDTRPALAFWGGAIDRLEEAGKIKTEFHENYEQQYSYLRIWLPS